MTMKLKVQHVMDATLAISEIIRDNRPMPQKGKYRLARMHPKLNAEFMPINARRDELIKAYDYHPMVPNPANNMSDEMREAQAAQGNVAQLVPKMIPSADFAVPADKINEFKAAWEEIANEEIEFDIEPIPLEQLCFADPNIDGSISGHEFIVLGDLVKE